MSNDSIVDNCIVSHYIRATKYKLFKPSAARKHAIGTIHTKASGVLNICVSMVKELILSHVISSCSSIAWADPKSPAI